MGMAFGAVGMDNYVMGDLPPQAPRRNAGGKQGKQHVGTLCNTQRAVLEGWGCVHKVGKARGMDSRGLSLPKSTLYGGVVAWV